MKALALISLLMTITSSVIAGVNHDSNYHDELKAIQTELSQNTVPCKGSKIEVNVCVNARYVSKINFLSNAVDTLSRGRALTSKEIEDLDASFSEFKAISQKFIDSYNNISLLLGPINMAFDDAKENFTPLNLGKAFVTLVATFVPAAIGGGYAVGQLKLQPQMKAASDKFYYSLSFCLNKELDN